MTTSATVISEVYDPESGSGSKDKLTEINPTISQKINSITYDLDPKDSVYSTNTAQVSTQAIPLSSALDKKKSIAAKLASLRDSKK
jgi:hypothetical protein